MNTATFRRLLISGLLLIGLAREASALVEAEGSYWWMSLDGDGKVGYKGVEGTRIDVDDDLGFDSSEGVESLRIIVGNVHQLGAAYLSTSLSADNQLNRTIHFRNKVYPVNTRISTDLDVDLFEAFYRFNVGTSLARGGFLLGGLYLRCDSEVRSPVYGRASGDFSSGMPFVGAFFIGNPVPFLGFRGSVLGSAWDLGDVQASFIDAQMGIEVETPAGIFGGVGYRYVNIDASDDEEPVDITLTLSGPMAYAGFEW